MLIASPCSLALMNFRVCAICQQLAEAVALALWVHHSLQRVQRSIWERRCIQLLPRSRPRELGLGDDSMKQYTGGGCPGCKRYWTFRCQWWVFLKNTLRNARLVSISFGWHASWYDVFSRYDWLFVENKNKAGPSTCLFFCTAGRKCWMPAPPRTQLTHPGLCQCCPPSAWLKPNAL